jgi:hypothetical protein
MEETQGAVIWTTQSMVVDYLLSQINIYSEAAVHLKTQIEVNSVTALITIDDQLLINGIDPQHYKSADCSKKLASLKLFF